MLRVGFFTGKLYSQEDFDKDRIKECAVVVRPFENGDDLEKIQEAKVFAQVHKIAYCNDCKSCEEARKTD